ncbi:MAG: B3/4 domain-containing protein, partial [Eubacterium sp.]
KQEFYGGQTLKFEVEGEVFKLLPEYIVGIVTVDGIDNHGENGEIEELLSCAVSECSSAFEGIKAKKADEVQPYREAFRKIGINPNRYMCSIEALIDRISKGKGMPHINPAVDLGNAVSLKYRLPIGAHDNGTIEDALMVRYTREGDVFIPFGSTEPDNPKDGEVVYASGNQVRTRRWTWRQSQIGEITEDTTAIQFPIDGFADFNKEQVESARDELAELLKKYFGGTVHTGMVDAQNPVYED